MKKFLIASIAMSLLSNIALGQDAASVSASPSPSPAGTEEMERVLVQSEEMDVTREAIVPSLGATRFFRKASLVLARFWRPGLRTIFRSLLARCRRSLDSAIQASSIFTQRAA